MEIKIVYHFSDCPAPGYGNTWLAPGSNNLDRPLDTVLGGTDPADAIEPELQAGDAFLFENRTFHRQGLNLTDRTRKVLMMGYSYAWLCPNDYVVQDRGVLERVRDPIERQLLGALRKPNTQIDDGPLGTWTERYAVRRAAEIAADARALTQRKCLQQFGVLPRQLRHRFLFGGRCRSGEVAQAAHPPVVAAAPARVPDPAVECDHVAGLGPRHVRRHLIHLQSGGVQNAQIGLLDTDLPHVEVERLLV